VTARALIPWLTSLLVHAGVLLVPLGLFLIPAQERPLPSVELTFTAARPGAFAARPGASAARSVQPRAGAVGARAVGVDPSAASLPSSPAFRTVPTLTGKSSTDESSGDTASADQAVKDAADGASNGTQEVGQAGQTTAGTSIGWAGAPRTVIRRASPVFPSVLSAVGQEVEGEARITVNPSGSVTRVEITRTTGYIEIDASVALALRDYLFSRVDSRVDALGTVKFRFRLEKTD
jgi:hypothetical protein